MGDFRFEFEGHARVSTDYREANTGGSGSGYASSERVTESLANSVPLSADRSASHAGDMVVRLRQHIDRL